MGLRRLQQKTEAGSKNSLESRLAQYRYRPFDYFRDILDVDSVWSGTREDTIGLAEIVDAYLLALRQQRERIMLEQGQIDESDLVHFVSGQPIKNWLSVDAGYNIGKTWIAAKILSHFFDCFHPAIGYCFAPGFDQLNDLLFKEIRVDRDGSRVLGETFERSPAIKYKSNHFVVGRATQGGQKKTRKERIQGQHNEFLIFILDEAEGIDDYVWESVRSMTSGGISIVLSLRNPRTTSCYANQIRDRSYVADFTISCLDHPNVVEGREVIGSAVRRTWVDEMIDEYSELVKQHDEQKHTFEVPWREGIFQPQIEFRWQVMGIASEGQVDNTFVSLGVYKAAIEREPASGYDPSILRIGIDAARYGFDKVTIYCKWNGRIWREKTFDKSDYHQVAQAVKQVCQEYLVKGVNDIAVRIDAGGGFGGGIADFLNYDAEIWEPTDNELWYGVEMSVIEVSFNSASTEPEKYRNLVTEMYYWAGQVLKDHALLSPTRELQQDLVESSYQYVVLDKRDVKVLVSKERFKTLYNRSPDDGDGFVLAAAPDNVFVEEVLIDYA